MKIAIVGATGSLGAPLADLLEAQGHEVRRLSRRSETYPVDLSTGEGLEAALDDVDVVVNAANTPPVPPQSALAVLVDGTRRLREATFAHHVCISIVGVDELAPHVGFYQAKVEQERTVKETPGTYTIVRATQFHGFLGAALARAGRARIEVHSKALFAPVAVDDVAVVVARVATGEPKNATINVTGPETLTLTQLRTRRGFPLPLPVARQMGRLLRGGALTHPNPDVRGVLTYAQWLAEQQGRPWRPAP
jgi:uncharacterized protein YbjT (DUF2867 family)